MVVLVSEVSLLFGSEGALRAWLRWTHVSEPEDFCCSTRNFIPSFLALDTTLLPILGSEAQTAHIRLLLSKVALILESGLEILCLLTCLAALLHQRLLSTRTISNWWPTIVYFLERASISNSHCDFCSFVNLVLTHRFSNCFIQLGHFLCKHFRCYRSLI